MHCPLVLNSATCSVESQILVRWKALASDIEQLKCQSFLNEDRICDAQTREIEILPEMASICRILASHTVNARG